MEKISPHDSNTLSIVARYCKVTDSDTEIRAKLEHMLLGTSTDAQKIGRALLDPRQENDLDPEHRELARLYRDNWALTWR